MDGALNSTMFADPVDKYQKQTLPKPGATSSIGPLRTFAPSTFLRRPCRCWPMTRPWSHREAATWTARLVNAVFVTGFGHQSALVAIPSLEGLPGIANMPYDASYARGTIISGS